MPMITPEAIKRKVHGFYRDAIIKWLVGDTTYYPRIIPANLRLDNQITTAITEVELLRSGAKETIGYGYTVHWEQRNSRSFKNNKFPVRLSIDSLDDLLKLTGNQAEFKKLEWCVQAIRDRLPLLEDWLREHWAKLPALESVLDDLILVTEYLQQHPRPQCFIRELPLPISTKLIEQHKPLLAAWFDRLLPASEIDHGFRIDDFEQRYGFRFAGEHVRMRLLDPSLSHELGLPTDDLSLPVEFIAGLNVRHVRVIIVENKINLLTLPELPRAVAFCGMGKAVSQLFDTPWLSHAVILYWGDLDVDGLEILALLRHRFRQTLSRLMDATTLQQYRSLTIPGNGRTGEIPALLNKDEAAAFEICSSKNLRLEQERIPHSCVLEIFNDAAFSRGEECS